MNFLKKLRLIPETLLAGVSFLLIPLLPRRVVIWLAQTLGGAAMRLSGRLRRVAMANLDLVFGDDLSGAEKQAIARRSFEVASQVMLDLFWFGLFSRKRVRKWVRYGPGFETFLKSSPMLGVTAHFGNWEVMGQAVALRGVPIVSVANPIGNVLVDILLNRLRRRTGQEISFKRGAVATLTGVLRAGKSSALLVDQNTLPRDGGAFVPFFGIPVPMTRTVGVLARRTGAQVWFAYCVAEKDGSYTVHTERLPGAEGSDWMRLIAGVLEEAIRKYPGQWVWMYKRWKYISDGVAPERYPFYARRMREDELRSRRDGKKV